MGEIMDDEKKAELAKRLPIEKAILRLIPTSRGKMISEIALFNIAYYKLEIQPTQLAQHLRTLLRDGLIYQPREGFYKKT